MSGGLEELRCIIQDTLDNICSPRSPFDVRTRALERLEKQLADLCLSRHTGEGWDHFLALQYTFECNVPSTLIGWISASTIKLEQILIQGVPDECPLASQLSRTLSIIQGVALNHDSSKAFLGRRCSLEILLELLLVSRHLTPSTPSADGDRSGPDRDKPSTDLPLTSTVLDTLLCILVDAPQALREFEKANGLQVVVRILKRAGTPREVRMKCLEFLYFYLLDETIPTETAPSQRLASSVPSVSTASAPISFSTTPSPLKPCTHLPKPSLNATPLRPLSRHGSGSSCDSSSRVSSSRSASASSMHSFTSTSSVSTSATSASSIPPSPEMAPAHTQIPIKPKILFYTPPSTLKFPTPKGIPRHDMMMLKRDVDYEPLSPKKNSFGVGTIERERVNTPTSYPRPRAQIRGHSHTPSRSYTQMSSSIGESAAGDDNSIGKRKTTEEKKQLLGTMLGNVDALVEGVRKAGIWGLS